MDLPSLSILGLTRDFEESMIYQLNIHHFTFKTYLHTLNSLI